MKHVSKLFPAVLLACSMAAQANVEIVIQQVGADVVVTGAGSIITTNENCGLPTINVASVSSKAVGDDFQMNSSLPSLVFGNPSSALQCFFMNAVRSGSPIGTNDDVVAIERTGDNFAMLGNPSEVPGIAIFLPSDYESANDLNFSAIFAGQTLAELGLLEGGGYTWEWSTPDFSGPVSSITQQSLSIVVRGAAISPPAAATPVPTLGAFSLMGLAGAIGAAGVAMNRRRKQ